MNSKLDLFPPVEHASPASASQTPEMTRQVYVLRTLGLSHDPFVTPVAEQELRWQEKATPFFSYYIDPLLAGEWSLRDVLREARSAFVFGPPGSGKTTLRYTLEADCRTQSLHTLIVTYELSHNLPQALTPEEHWRQLAEELAVDLFIQIIEQFNALSAAPSAVQRNAWRDQLAWARPRLRRTVRRILEEPQAADGLETLWLHLGRPAVRYVEPSPQLRALLHDCWPADQSTNAPFETGADALRAGLRAARLWGFERVFVLVDGVDAPRRDPESMYALINPLLTALPDWQTQHVFFKFFLPLELRVAISNQFGAPLGRLPFSPVEAIMRWDDEALRKILAQRFQAANRHWVGFDELTAPDLEGQIDRRLIQAADGSPRRLLQLASGLIDAHAARAPEQLAITAADWNRLCRDWRQGAPAPVALPEPVQRT